MSLPWNWTHRRMTTARAFGRGAGLAGLGADAVTIADCPIGRPRADSSLLACKIKRDIGYGAVAPYDLP